MTISQVLSNEETGGRTRSVASMRRRIEREKRQMQQARERAAQRSDSSIEVRATSCSAGYGVHSSKIITMSEPRSY